MKPYCSARNILGDVIVSEKLRSLDYCKEKLIIIAIPHHELRFPVIKLLSNAGYNFICAKNLPKLCHEIVNLEEEGVLIVDIFAYPTSLSRLLRTFSANGKLSLVFLMNKEELHYSQRFAGYGEWLGIEKEYLNKKLLSTIDQAVRTRSAQKEQSPIQKREVYSVGKKEESVIYRKMHRRTFLKGSAAAAGLAGVAVIAPGNTIVKALAAGNGTETASPEEQIFNGVCRANCFGCCRLSITVRNGKMVKTKMAEYPDPYYNRICLRGLSHVHQVYSSDRLKWPLKRAGKRGEGKWEQISWEEAIQTITDKWKEYQRQYGNNSIAFTYESGNMCISSRNVARLAQVMGITQLASDADNAAYKGTIGPLGIGPYYAANEPADIVNARTIFCWANNITNSNLQQYHGIMEAKARGAKLVVIDPNFTTIAAKADIHVPIRPATDAVLAMAMINVVLDEGLADDDYIRRASVGPFLVKETDGKYLRQSDLDGSNSTDFVVWDSVKGTHGLLADTAVPAIHGTYEIQGIRVTTAYDLIIAAVREYTVEKASEICDVPAETIRELARLFATNTPTTITHGLGTDHYINGQFSFRAMIALAIITGNVGKPGASASFNMPMGFELNPAASATKAAPPGTYRVLSSVELPEVMENGKLGGEDYFLKSLYVYNTNFLASVTERETIKKAEDKLDFIVVADMVMSETADFADIVLPVCHWFEMIDCNTFEGVPFLNYQEKAIEPAFESKSDYEIANLLGRGMGFTEDFSRDIEEFMEILVGTEQNRSDIAKALGITWEKLKEKKVMRNILPGKSGRFVHGEGDVFPTPTGRAQFYFEDLFTGISGSAMHDQRPYDINMERKLGWIPPREAWYENPLIKKFPIIYMQTHSKWRAGTVFNKNRWLRELDPEPIVYINDADAAARGIKTGDTVKIFNDRGHVVIKAAIHSGMRPGVCSSPKGWAADQFIDGHPSNLTSRVSYPTNPNQCLADLLVEIVKI